MTTIDSAFRVPTPSTATSFQHARLEDIASRLTGRAPPPQPPTPEESYAAYRAAHLFLSPQEALASSAELGPPTGGPLHDNRADNVHTEIKVNGKVVARTYNTRAVEIADEYGFLSEELGFNMDESVGPDLAVDRAARIEAALKKYGAKVKDEMTPDEFAQAAMAHQPIVELFKTAFAQTQEEWLAGVPTRSSAAPGTFMARAV